MSTSSQKRTRSERVAAVSIAPGVWGRLWNHLRRGQVLVRLGLCALASIALLIITHGWAPPRHFRHGMVPSRDIIARVQFDEVDREATEEARKNARQLSIAYYDQDPSQLNQLRAKLENEVSQLLGAEKYEDVADLWKEFRLPLAEGTPEPTEQERKQQFDRFREALSEEGAFEMFKTALADSLKPFMEHGLIKALPPEHNANEESIFVRPVGTEGFEKKVDVSDVLIESAAGQLQRTLEQKMPSLELASRSFAWLSPQLPETLRLNTEATLRQQDKDAAAVPDQKKVYPVGTTLAEAGVPIDDAEIRRLELEYRAEMDKRPLPSSLARSLAVLGMHVSLYTLCGFYIYRRDPRIIVDLKQLVILLALVVVVVGLMILTARDGWRAESVPLLIFAMMLAVAYQQELALLLAAAVTLLGVIAIGLGLPGMIVLMATASGAILALDQVRNRSKLLAVGVIAGIVAFFTTLGVGVISGQPIRYLLTTGALYAFWSVIAGTLMVSFLPGVEWLFGVLTDSRLIQLGDPADPLLQELIRRAPGTYNHSITVASLAEAAAESIGARGLLVRVGAYFHDIGKMLKPGYFIENQGHGDNRHQSLVPAMSTLVIIAHVKDGVDLARQHKLPEQIIDFIQQHHGTTLVEYFYRQASDRRESDPDGKGKEVDETSFRYPGPKPQTREAGVLMLADAVESASRVLVEPTPARIESLVEELSRKRLLDGQFDECGLTLQEVSKIEDSLVKSLTAVYHGRVKYPDQETA